MRPIYHLLTRAEWDAARAAAEYRSASLATEGFVHFSFVDQVAGSANRFYRDVDDLVAVQCDPNLIGAEIVVEDTYGSGVGFPHVYGPIPVTAAIAVHALRRDAGGDYVFPHP